jgi:hypothetical protein
LDADVPYAAEPSPAAPPGDSVAGAPKMHPDNDAIVTAAVIWDHESAACRHTRRTRRFIGRFFVLTLRAALQTAVCAPTGTRSFGISVAGAPAGLEHHRNASRAQRHAVQARGALRRPAPGRIRLVKGRSSSMRHRDRGVVPISSRLQLRMRSAVLRLRAPRRPDQDLNHLGRPIIERRRSCCRTNTGGAG